MNQMTHARMFLFLGVLCLGLTACSGVAHKTKRAATESGAVQVQDGGQSLENYPSWRPLSEEPLTKGILKFVSSRFCELKDVSFFYFT